MGHHGQYIGDVAREGSCVPECLHTDDHGGPPYTLALRVERGFGDLYHCARTSCKHSATDHVSTDGRARATGCFKCGCPNWLESQDETSLSEERNTPMSDPRRNVRVLRPVIEGVGPEAPVVENEIGAKQSSIPAVFTTLPLRALWEIAKLQKYGDEKYGPHNWRGIAEQDHLNHALVHIWADQMGDTSDDHLTHAAWRLLAALEGRVQLLNRVENGDDV